MTRLPVIFGLLLIFAFGNCSPVRAAVPAAESATQQLVDTLQFGDQMRTVLLAGNEQGMRRYDAEHPEEVAEIEQRYPGFGEVTRAAAREKLAELFDSRAYPRIRERMARALASRLTSDEVEALRAFYASPPGQRSLEAMLAQSLGRSVTPSAEDARAISRFDNSPVGIKWRELGTVMQGEVAAIMDEELGAIQADVDAHVRAAIAAHMQRSQAN